MTVTVGRLSLPGPQNPTVNSEGVLSHSGVVHGLSQAETNARTRQILGLKQEGILPIIWADGEWDGYYRVTDASVDIVYLTSARSVVRYQLQAQLVARAANFESTLSGGPVTNAHGLTGEQWMHVGSSMTDVSFNPERTPTSSMNRTGVDGTDHVAVWPSGALVPWARWQRSPADWYRNACRVEVGGYVVTGTDAPDTPTNWLITNQLVRVQPTGVGRISVDVFSGGAWRTKTFRLQLNSVSNFAWKSVRIIENTVARVAIRLTSASGTPGEVLITDISLRRGAPYATVNMKINGTRTFSVVTLAVEAATAITGAIRATANDADGNRYVITTPVTFTSDLVQGGITTATTTSATIHVGYEVGGTAATTNNTAADVVKQTLYHTGEAVDAVPL